MSAMRKIKFAVLESSLLARKGDAKPALHFTAINEPHGAGEDAVTLPAPAGSASLESEGHAPDPEAMLAQLINRPGAMPAPPQPPAPTAKPAAAAVAPTATVSETLSAWTAKVTAERRYAANLHPRGLSRKQAAAYVGLSLTLFYRMIKEGALPGPLRFGRRIVWDRSVLDRALDRLSGIVKVAQPATTD